MILQKLDIIIATVATIVAAIVCYITNVTLFDLAVRLITVIIVFYIIGFIAKMYLTSKVFTPDEKEEENAPEQPESVLESEEEAEEEAESIAENKLL